MIVRTRLLLAKGFLRRWEWKGIRYDISHNLCKSGSENRFLLELAEMQSNFKSYALSCSFGHKAMHGLLSIFVVSFQFCVPANLSYVVVY